ncbi:MAG TPA: DNA methyltransferase [Sphingomicrobium sp.]|jgi:site-specific DNA-methyltransferase (adenine-specific)|nr:DNA methyltransferase [Sphingomicrobium sp.]
MTNKLFYGDNLDVLRAEIGSESVDLVYLDPPFNSNANYNVLFKSKSGEGADAQITAFEDTWHWNDHAEDAFDQVVRSGNTDAAELLRAMRGFLGENDMMAYLAMMAIRLIELHRVLKATGSLYLHCDPTASHYLKLLLDAVFGKENFQNEIIWKRTSAHSSAKRYGPVHDTILFYSKSPDFIWNRTYTAHDPAYLDLFFDQTDSDGRRWKRMDLTGAGTRNGETGQIWRGIDVTAKGRHWAYPPSKLDELDAAGRVHWPAKEGGMPRLKQYPEDLPGVPLQDIFADIRPMHNLAEERLGYPTQKPLALLERIIAASSNEDDVVLDPFCGCGTALHAAQKLGRQWIEIDVTHLAIHLIEHRLKDAFPGIQFEVHGTPKDLASARDLAARDKHQFELWALAQVDAQAWKGGRKGADGGIDGIIYFKPDGKRTEKAIVEVKGGGTGVKDIGRLAQVMEREKAPLGVFITAENPTRNMEADAAAVGRFTDEWGRTYPRLQIITLAELFQGKKPDIPFVDPSSIKRAKREDEASGKQGSLL